MSAEAQQHGYLLYGCALAMGINGFIGTSFCITLAIDVNFWV